ncbi:hypothetical protein [Spirosoma pollinicola]|uniref:Uncharacterized protein n=1 Tax=Spirosoma pollinicola TaxID=2057025 RepID=A0A2K8Z2L8_9BACT|nr:hypothetical protein [Spirosoma pollinicola]AUD04122.1 hypothetical protein CWM47_21180 [Spirosoma pollinicola]
MVKITSLCFLLSLLSCRQNTPTPDNTAYACGKIISKRYLAISAPVAYSKAIDSYYIITDSSIIDPMATREVSVFCNLPDSYKVPGKMIKFDGSFAQLYDTTGTAKIIKNTFKTEWANYLSIDKIY